MTKILLLLVAVGLMAYAPAFSSGPRRLRRQPAHLLEQCQRPASLNSSLQNCNAIKKYFYYDAENRICNAYEDCEENGANKFSLMRTCLDTCFDGPKKPARSKWSASPISPRTTNRSVSGCQQQLKGKAPERCRWVRATVAKTDGCPKYQLQCTGAYFGHEKCSFWHYSLF